MAGLTYKPATQITPEAPSAPAADNGNINVADAGTGVKEATNPLARFMKSYTPEEYDALGKGGAANGTATNSGSGADALLAYAKQFVGTPYKWGGSSPLGFDCSGFVQYVFKKFGVDLPRVSYQQANYGKRVPVDQAKAGDILAWDFNDRNNGADHVAIALGNGMMIESPAPGKSVRIVKIYGNPWAVSMNL